MIEDANPFRSPRTLEEQTADHWSVAGTVFFAINFAVAAFLLVICIVAVVQAETPYAFLGGIMLLPAVTVAAIMEWVAWYRRKYALEKILGGLCFGVGALAMFGVVANVAEALQTSWPDGFEWFVGIGLTIAWYFVICGAWRVWHSVTIARRLAIRGRSE